MWMALCGAPTRPCLAVGAAQQPETGHWTVGAAGEGGRRRRQRRGPREPPRAPTCPRRRCCRPDPLWHSLDLSAGCYSHRNPWCWLCCDCCVWMKAETFSLRVSSSSSPHSAWAPWPGWSRAGWGWWWWWERLYWCGGRGWVPAGAGGVPGAHGGIPGGAGMCRPGMPR